LVEGADPAGTGTTDGVWRDPDWLLCRDDRWRRVEPGTFPLADGVSGRMGLLRGYGNAIVPPLAAEFVRAFLESLPERLR
jgi:DNA (cytosine-5)-methyltransferase 1